MELEGAQGAAGAEEKNGMDCLGDQSAEPCRAPVNDRVPCVITTGWLLLHILGMGNSPTLEGDFQSPDRQKSSLSNLVETQKGISSKNVTI